MKKINLFCISTLLTILSVFRGYSQTSDNYSLLLSVAVRLQKNITKSSEEIAYYTQEIEKCGNTISKSQNIIKLAKQNNKPETEKIAADALAKSTNARNKYIKLLEAAKNNKKQSEAAFAAIKKSLATDPLKGPAMDAIAVNYKGRVAVMKQTGESIELSSSQNPCFKNGDVITTFDTGKVELVIMEGRGSVILGPNSKLKLQFKNDSTDIIELSEGKIKAGLLKADAYSKKISEIYESFNKDSLLKSLSTYEGFSYEKWLAKVRASHFVKKFEVRTPSAALAIRGTEFTVTVRNGSETEIRVIEGIVEVKPLDGEEALRIIEGQTCLIFKGTARPSIIETDTLKNEEWWNYED